MERVMSDIHVETTLAETGEHAELWVSGGRFVTGPLDGVPTHAGGFAIPGLVDAHAHLALASPLATGSEAERVRASARAHLDAGVLVIREPGGPSRTSSTIGDDERLPTVFTAGQFLAPPGRYFPGLARQVSDSGLVAAALDELAHARGWVKVIGDFFDDEGRFAVNYRTETLAEVAIEVHAAGGRITMHATIPDSVQQAIDAGFDGIEHGTVVEGGQVLAMAANGITWTPTALIDDLLRDTGEGMLGRDGAAWLNNGMAGHGDAICRAHELGVRVLAGTDAGMNPHGVVAREIRLLHQFGLPATAALAAGSWDARAYLGLPGIEIGAPADLIVFPDDPREDLEVLDHPSLVLLRGHRVCGPELR
jgi:imidazolonepropionase-like amidohydrolase